MSFSSIGGTYGLSGSGMDIDSIVTKLMMGQQAKSDALLQKKTVLEWQKTSYNTVYDDINNFRTTTFNYKLQGTLSPNKVSSSNTSVVTATANAEAADVNHSLVVAQLASGVNLTSASNVTTGASKDTIVNQFYDGVAPTGLYKFTIANGAASASITIDPNGSINDLVSQINSAGINVKASYDSTLDRFFMSTTNTGSSAGLSIVKTEGDASWGGDFFVDKLKLPSDVATTTGITGLNAEFKLDGVHLSQASNTFSISGVTYSLTGVSPGATGATIAEKLDSGQATTISVTNDTDKAVASIQSLVDSYNKILADINGKLSETRYKDFPPLTDAQKSVMKESDITAWEAKAKSGMLRNDQTLASLVNTMRNAFSNPVASITGPYNSGASIGITTGTYTEGGKLYLNTDKLRTALQDDPDVLSQLFGASGKNPDGTIDPSSQGIAGRLYDGIKTKMDQVAQIAGTTAGAQYDTKSSFAKRITAYNKQITNAADRFDKVQTAYYKQFNAMEVALQQLSSQNSWLASQFGNSNG
ncbi:flagellar filament capping protein FliD [Desulfosporosinus sp. BICA1-9]|uniref:flagellar filament capping protein FliD n=1 Tax=Desulfosporosinus sp. BICA1-9 TaxID=1531958 RepID=UPI00054C121C|nr:flagellar filament capping protein FliD [Desulfosporosinus sp. BICA1-9]KJS90038.1 MAG: flagellar hook protein [Desulfosporosinus sp. BICA1-9]HBW36446.1 flagellar hook protein [Desulfosporosinus sp.]